MVNVSKEKIKEIRKKLPKNYRELICETQSDITPRQITMIMRGESRNPGWRRTVVKGINKILRDLDFSTEEIKKMW
jgi:hypothetical protein